MKPYEITVLRHLSKIPEGLELEKIIETNAIDKPSASSALEKLFQEKLCELSKTEEKYFELTEEGQTALRDGTPEARLLAAVGSECEMAQAYSKASLSPQEQPIAILVAPAL